MEKVKSFLEKKGVPYVVIADIHWGAMPAEKLFDEMSIFLETINEIKDGVIFINGDYFHKKLNGNSKHLHYAMRMFSAIMAIAKVNNTSVRIIKGTESHDEDQLEIFRASQEALDMDLVIYDTVTTDNVKGLDVLYLPEEYPEDGEAHYRAYMDKKYDFIMGHGMLDIAGIMAAKQETELTRPDIKVFNASELSDMVNGYVYFGHVHTPMIHKNARYVGSYSVFGHGEEHAKGFYIGVFDTDNKNGEDIFIENTKRRIYRTFKIDKKSTMFDLQPFDIIDNVMKIFDENRTHEVRFKIDIPDTYEQSALLHRSLNTLGNNHRNLSLKITQGIKEKEIIKEEKKVKEIFEKFGKIFDNNIPVEERLSFFILQKHQIGIDVSVIKEYM